MKRVTETHSNCIESFYLFRYLEIRKSTQSRNEDLHGRDLRDRHNFER